MAQDGSTDENSIEENASSASVPVSPQNTPHPHQHILDDPDFQNLARQKNSISTTLTLLTLLFYFGFVFLLAFAPQMLAGRLSQGISWGIPLGIGVIIVSWILTGIYVRWANGPYDDMIARVKKKIVD